MATVDLRRATGVLFVSLGAFLGVVREAAAQDFPAIWWHNRATGEIQEWAMSSQYLAEQKWVVDEKDQTVHIGSPYSIVGLGHFNGDKKQDLLWHQKDTGEIQVWFMDGLKRKDRGIVVDEDGQYAYVGPPFGIVGAGHFNDDQKSDIVWYNSETGEVQIWLMDGTKRIDRKNVVDREGVATAVGDPFSIVALGQFDANPNTDILWHNNRTGEIQIWYMEGNVRAGRAVVTDEKGQPAYVGGDFGIVGAREFNYDGNTDILWYNSRTGEMRMWFMSGPKLKEVKSVVHKDKADEIIYIGPPNRIVGNRGVVPPEEDVQVDAVVTTEEPVRQEPIAVIKPVAVYDKPFGDGQEIGELEFNEKGVTLVADKGDDWYEIKWPGGQGFVYSGPSYRSLKGEGIKE